MGGTVWKRAGVLVTSLVLVGLVSCTGSGSNDADPTTTRPTDSTSDTSGDVASTTEGDETSMPDLVGVTEDEARAELQDVGVDDKDIEIVEQESLEDPGTVVDQVPGPDQPIVGSITLSIAAPVEPVPDFTGKRISEVKDWAEERGISVRETTVLDDTLAEGEVIATTPKAGAKASSEIAVEVASKPIVGSLADVEMIDTRSCGSVETGEANVNGEFIQDSLLVAPYRSGDPCIIEYDFGRDWQQLKFTLGIQDDSPSDAKVRVEVFGDDKELMNSVVSFAEAGEEQLDVTDVLRVKIQITWLAGEDGTVTAVLGDFRRIGSPTEVPTTTTTTP